MEGTTEQDVKILERYCFGQHLPQTPPHVLADMTTASVVDMWVCVLENTKIPLVVKIPLKHMWLRGKKKNNKIVEKIKLNLI